MNTTKIAGLYPFWLDCLRTKAAQPHRSLLDMLEIRLRADLILASGALRHWVALRDLENPVRRFDQLGLPTDELISELVPPRVWAWAEQQLPASPQPPADLNEEIRQLLAPATGLIVRLHASTKVEGLPGQPVPQDAPSTWLMRQGPAEAFAVLLRGVRAWQTKRRKRARRLLAQLSAQHIQQQRVLAMVPAAPSYCLADARTTVGFANGGEVAL